MADIAIFRINYKSDFILTLQSDAGWMTPFCIKFWTGAPSQAYFAGYDGTTYTHCAPVDGDPTKLSVQFDDHHLPIGDMKFQIGYHFTVADFPTSIEDEVINQAAVIIDNDGEQQQVMLDFNGETAPEIAFAMPAYANEAQRIANEQARIAAEEQRVSNEQQRISNEEGRISAEESRQENEQQRIHNEETRIAEFASLKVEAIAATGAANDAATFANEKAQLAADKAALAQTAATLANDKAQLAADKASLAQAAATLANDKAALAQQKADYAQAKAEYAQAQGDYAKAQSDIALADHERAETDHERAEADHDTATDDHTTATSDHTQAESDHTRAEADHTTAASDHTQASSDHDRAESDHTQAGQDHTRAESDHTTAAADHTRAESDHAAVEAYVDSLGAFDISAYHATGSVLAKYADLTAALGTNGANIPDKLRKGGMSVKFVLSSDNKYVQARCMAQNFTTDVTQWQGVDEEIIIGSKNLITSGSVANVVGIFNPFEYIRHNTSNYIPSDTGNRYSVLFNVMPGDTIVAESNWGDGLFAGIWQNRNRALVGDSNEAIQNIRGYSTTKMTGVVNYSGVLRIGTKKTDNSAFTQADIDAFLASFTYTIIRKDSLQDQINKEVEARKLLPTSTSFMAIYTGGYFNANNTTQKVEIPAFKCWVNGQVLDFPAQQIDYYWVNNSSTRELFALVLSDDLTSIEMIEWTGIANKKNIIAFIARPSISVTSVNMFYGCNSDSQKESIWRINGSVFNINEVYDSIQRGYPTSNKYYGMAKNMTHLCFPVKAGDTVNVKTGQYYTFIGYVKTYPYPVAGKAINYSSAEGYTDRIAIGAGQNYTDTVPNDANFIIVGYGNDSYANLDVQMVAVNNKVVYLKWNIINNIEERQDDVDNNIEAINETIGSSETVIDSPDVFPYKRRHRVSTSAESATGNRYTIGLDILKGTAIKVRSTYAPGINVVGYNTFNNACVGGTTGVLQRYGSGYSTDEIVGVANVDQVLTVKWKNSDESAITDAQIEQMLASLTVEVVIPGNGLIGDVDLLQEQVQEIINNPTDSSSVESDKKLLYIGPLVQKSVSGNTFTDSSVTVTQHCALAVPYYNATVDINIPVGYSVGFKTGYSTTGTSLTWVVDSGLLSNGDNYTFDGHNGQVYRVYFKKSDGAEITVEEVNGLIASGAIQLTYLSPDGSIVTRNSNTESYVKGLMRKFTGTLANDDSLHKMAVLTHLSDIHGDARRYENFVEYSDAIEADAALVSGDLVPMCGAQDFTDYIDDIADKYNVMLLPCMGNHDARGNSTEQAQNAVLAHSIQKYELQTPAGKTYPTYYYKDIVSQSIRIIALNLYCAGQKGTNDWRLTQDQMTWFVNTLASTPAGYGVIVMMHSPETTTSKDNDHAKFYQKYENGTIVYNNPYLPIRKIIDAFISKTTFSGTFDEEITGSVTETITISADFTSVDASTEFICYVTGHRHRDCIGYVNGATNMQLMCNIALGFSLYGDSNYHYYAEEVDVPRGGKGFVQDLMNVYVVDRATGNLRIARVGSNMNHDFEMRDYMIIPYKAS